MGEIEIFRISLEIWQLTGDSSPGKETDTEQFWIYRVKNATVMFILEKINGDLIRHTDGWFFNLHLLL